MTGVPASAAGGSGAPGAQGTKPVPGGKLGAAAVNEARIWNIANILTMVRLLLVPALVMLMLAGGGYDPAWRSLAWASFAIAMITDLFDGHLARAYNLVTDFGKIADPIADKAIMGAALICLSALGDLPWWVTGVILGRELGITLLRLGVIRYGVIPASRGGKLKTLTQGVAVGMYILALTGPLATLRFWVMAVAVVLTVATGLDYVKQAAVLWRRGKAAAERDTAEGETAERDTAEGETAQRRAAESAAGDRSPGDRSASNRSASNRSAGDRSASNRSADPAMDERAAARRARDRSATQESER
jgi:CDP-diacylglycerol---glycerol-3-phosphate 3-phosphatidyltransferase